MDCVHRGQSSGCEVLYTPECEGHHPYAPGSADGSVGDEGGGRGEGGEGERRRGREEERRRGGEGRGGEKEDMLYIIQMKSLGGRI